MALFKKKNYNGITSNTPTHLQLGAGAFFKNFIVGTDTYASAKAGGKLIGATSGGGTFSAVPTINNISIDGGGSRVKGFADVPEWEVHLSANVKELSADSIRDALGLADIITTSTTEDVIPAGYSGIIKGRTGIEDTDYIENITWVGCITGSEKPVIIQLFNGLNEAGLTYNMTDDNNGTMALDFYAYNTLEEFMDDEVSAPFKIYYPTIAAASGNPVVSATATANSVLLTWRPINGATKYAVKSYSGSTYSTLDDTLTEPWFEVGSLSASTTYSYLVQAYVSGAWTPAENAAYNINVTTLAS